MTEDECWSAIESYTLAGDWNGLLVMADWLQEQGQEEMAGTIRWMARHGIRVRWVEMKEGKRKFYAHLFGEQFTGRDAKEVVEALHTHRIYHLAYYA